MMQREVFKPYKRVPVYGSEKELTARVIREAGGPKTVAARLNRSVATIYAYADPTNSMRITVDQALAITFPGSTAYAETFALMAGGTFTPHDDPETTLPEAIGGLTANAAKLAKMTMLALADGNYTTDEARDALQEVDRVARDLVRARAHLRARAKGEQL